MLDTKRLQYLKAVYDYQNFTRASEALYVSQSTISTAVSSLENELGVKLIIRNSKKLLFTPDGELFIEKVNEILKLCREAEQMMQARSDSAEQRLSLGISSSISNIIVPAIFTAFVENHPRLSIRLEEGAMEDHLDLLQKGALDLAYNAIPDDPEAFNLAVVPVSTAKIFAVVQPSHPLSKEEIIPLSMLQNEKMIMMSESSKVMSIMINSFEEQGIVPDIVFHYEQIACMVNVVEACNYVGVLSVVGDKPTAGLGNLILRPIKVDSFPVGFIMSKEQRVPKVGYELIKFVKDLEAEE